jgi:hypothetical protein
LAGAAYERVDVSKPRPQAPPSGKSARLDRFRSLRSTTARR